MGDLPEACEVAEAGLMPADGSNPSKICPENWDAAVEATGKLIQKVKPNPVSKERRNDVVRYIQRLILKCLPAQVKGDTAQVFSYGSEPFETFLPGEDIDLTVFGHQNVKDTWADAIRMVLEEEGKNTASESVVRDVQIICAEVKIVRCIVQDIVVNVSFHQMGGLVTLCFLDEVSKFIGERHLLFKSSIILIKAWCCYESCILGAHHGLISTDALEMLVVYIFQFFRSTLKEPLDVLYKFLDYFSKFDWDTYCISLHGPVRISLMLDSAAEIPEVHARDLLLDRRFLCFTAHNLSVLPSTSSDKILRAFQHKYLNIVDPLKLNNNLGCSVRKGNLDRIRRALSYGAEKLALILCQPKISIANELHKFFRNTMAKYGSLHTTVFQNKDQPSKPSTLDPSKHNPVMVVAPDGMVYIVDSGKNLGSFSSGQSIYSSYQGIPSQEGENLNASSESCDFYIDCGEDWELYLHKNGRNKMKLRLTAEEFVRRTSFVSTDGGVMLGSKKTAVFQVDANTGKIVRTFRSDDLHGADETSSVATNNIDERLLATPTDTEHIKKPLYVTRTDYAVNYTSLKTGKVLWHLMFAHIEASYQCDGIENLLGGFPHDEKFKSGQGLDAKLPMHCELSPVVYHFRDHSSLEAFLKANSMQDAIPRGELLSFDPSNGNDTYFDGRKIGGLITTNREIAKGSNGNIVIEGNYKGHSVAVKCLVRSDYSIAVKEIQDLIASYQHPNIIRWYGMESDQDFVYISLERCTCNLHKLISACSSQNLSTPRDQDHESSSVINCNMQFLETLGSGMELKLWNANGYPSACLLELMRHIVCGLVHLHEQGIVHGDLKPQNVLIIIKDGSITAKISDMCISKHLNGDKPSLTRDATGFDSSGWQAPEQLLHQCQTRPVDFFSLGCIIFFCMIGCQHRFGENIERDREILNDKDLFRIVDIPEATDLISQLLHSDPNKRPKAIEVINHPFFWNSETRLSFLRDVSDRVELEDRKASSPLLEALDSIGKVVSGGKWDKTMSDALIKDIGSHRSYKFDSLRDLIRFIRNKLNHYWELSEEIQALWRPFPQGFDLYFSTKFPKLLMKVYRVIVGHCGEEDMFKKYFRSERF